MAELIFYVRSALFLRASIPVAAKFSGEFYDRLGHRMADELVDWFNAVDTIYRSELRELFDSRFAQFDTKLELRLGQLDAKLERRVAELRAEFHTALAQTKTEMIRGMFIFWIGTIASLAGLMVAIMR